MKKHLLLLLSLLFVATAGFAERVSQDDAALVATNFMNAGSTATRSGAKAASPKKMVLKKAATATSENQYYVYENANGWCYHTDGKTAWVKTGVTIEGIEHIEYLPVMDFKNRSIPLDSITSFDVNKAIQRSLTKAVARHGLGLYIYAGEDLPEGEDKPEPRPAPKPVEEPKYDASSAIKAFCAQAKISTNMFVSIYDALCEQGRTKRIPSTKMTEEECIALLALVKTELEKAS